MCFSSPRSNRLLVFVPSGLLYSDWADSLPWSWLLPSSDYLLSASMLCICLDFWDYCLFGVKTGLKWCDLPVTLSRSLFRSVYFLGSPRSPVRLTLRTSYFLDRLWYVSAWKWWDEPFLDLSISSASGELTYSGFSKLRLRSFYSTPI